MQGLVLYLAWYNADRYQKFNSQNQGCNAVGLAEGLCINVTSAGKPCTAGEGKPRSEVTVTHQPATFSHVPPGIALWS